MAGTDQKPDIHVRPSGLFVTGTDTEVGKTVLSAALTAAIRASDRLVRAYKPVVTGIDETSGEWPADHVLLGALCDLPPAEVAPLRYGPPVSPHLAAALTNAPVDGSKVIAAALRTATSAAESGATLVVEGLGGLLAPLTETLSVRTLASKLGLPLLIAARAGLGTINHTLLSIEAARAADLEVRAVVMTPWPAEPSTLEYSNRETIERLGQVEVAGLPYVAKPMPKLLASAGNALPWRSWLEA
jgi:dethiobiotin synthetase